MAAIDAPIGAKMIVSGVIQRKPIKLTKPYVPIGASLGVLPNINMTSAPGKEIISPIAEAVPTALWVG